MNRDGTYADHICLEALSQMLSCNILAVHSNDPNVTVGSHDAYTCTLVLGYLTDIEHYVSLEPLSWYVQVFDLGMNDHNKGMTTVIVQIYQIKLNTCTLVQQKKQSLAIQVFVRFFVCYKYTFIISDTAQLFSFKTVDQTWFQSAITPISTMLSKLNLNNI